MKTNPATLLSIASVALVATSCAAFGNKTAEKNTVIPIHRVFAQPVEGVYTVVGGKLNARGEFPIITINTRDASRGVAAILILNTNLSPEESPYLTFTESGGGGKPRSQVATLWLHSLGEIEPFPRSYGPTNRVAGK